MATAKVFWSGNSQAIRLPKELWFPADTEEVDLHREGNRLVVELVRPEAWPPTFWRAFEGMPDDFERPPVVTNNVGELDRMPQDLRRELASVLGRHLARVLDSKGVTDAGLARGFREHRKSRR